MALKVIRFVLLSFAGIFLTAQIVEAAGPVLYQGDTSVPHRKPAFGPRPRLSAPTAAVQQTDEGLICTTINYEGVGDLSPIPEFDGISSPGWLGIIDADAGGSGNFAFEPSPETIAFWLGGDSGSRDITIATPASKLEFFYASFVTIQLDAFDSEGNIVATVLGPPNWNQGSGGDPSGDFNKWDPIKVETDRNLISKIQVSGNVNQTGIDNLTVCRRPTIHSVEVTQAIQEWQKLDDLKTDLNSDHEPPVPIIAGKPAALRVYLDQVQNVTEFRVNVEITGVMTQSKSLIVQPHCTPELRRRGESGCQSIDFYFIPPTGQWTITLRLLDENDVELENHDLPFSSRSADSLVLRSVSICDARRQLLPPLPFQVWECADGSQLAGMADFLRRTAPTNDVQVSVTNHFVRRDTASYSGINDWWNDAIRDVHNLYSLFDAFLSLFGEQRYYYGLIRPALPGSTGGMAHDIPARGAGSRSSVIRLGVETASEVVAHETGHMLGRRHTNTDVPRVSTPPGCYSLAQDNSTDWPFVDNRIQSSTQLEVGFDVSARQPVLPENHFDWMSYCTPRWISPHTYRNAMTTLHATSVPVTATLALSPEVGLFWTVSGTFTDMSVSLDPLFILETQGSMEVGEGSHRIEVRDGIGGALFSRFFTPSVVQTETGGEEVIGPPTFFELVPVQFGAAQIVIIDPNGADIGSLNLSGAPPTVQITFPQGGETLSSVQEITWSITDADSTSHTVRVDYSADGGLSWVNLGQVDGIESLPVNFDAIPGSISSSVLKVIASDGVNTGTAISGTFGVAKKVPVVKIISPEADTIFRVQDLVWLRGYAYDVDDGFLDGTMTRWQSDRDGVLGGGASLPITTLSEGHHQITLTATDDDGNIASQSTSIVVAGPSPTLDLSVEKLDVLPTTCVKVTIDAQPGLDSVDLSTVEYSLNGGQNWVPISTDKLPYTFFVPGAGFFPRERKACFVSTTTAF